MGRGLKNFLGSLSLAIFYVHLIHLCGWEGCPSLFIIPMDAFGISIRGTLSASSLVPHFSDQSYAPGWAPGLPPAKSGPESRIIGRH